MMSDTTLTNALESLQSDHSDTAFEYFEDKLPAGLRFFATLEVLDFGFKTETGLGDNPDSGEHYEGVFELASLPFIHDHDVDIENQKALREVLGLWLSPKEGFKFWIRQEELAQYQELFREDGLEEMILGGKNAVSIADKLLDITLHRKVSVSLEFTVQAPSIDEVGAVNLMPMKLSINTKPKQEPLTRFNDFKAEFFCFEFLPPRYKTAFGKAIRNSKFKTFDFEDVTKKRQYESRWSVYTVLLATTVKVAQTCRAVSGFDRHDIESHYTDAIQMLEDCYESVVFEFKPEDKQECFVLDNAAKMRKKVFTAPVWNVIRFLDSLLRRYLGTPEYHVKAFNEMLFNYTFYCALFDLDKTGKAKVGEVKPSLFDRFTEKFPGAVIGGVVVFGLCILLLVISGSAAVYSYAGLNTLLLVWGLFGIYSIRKIVIEMSDNDEKNYQRACNLFCEYRIGQCSISYVGDQLKRFPTGTWPQELFDLAEELV
jgi:hypothetical protein